MLALVLGVAPQSVAADQAWREQSRRTVPAAGLDLVVVENARGRIEVRPSPDADLHITALKIARANSGADAREIARATSVELQRDGSRYLIRVKYPRKESIRVNFWEGFDLSMPRLEVRMTVEVPAALGVQLTASSGDLFTHDLRGEQRLRASSGDVSVDAAAGPVDVTTSSGDVSLADARAARVATTSGDVEVIGRPRRLAVTTSSGDVAIDEVSDSLRVETASGDVTVERAGRDATVSSSSGEVRMLGASGRLSVSTVSGEIRASVVAPLREASISSSSGDIRLGLDPNVGCTLEMRTSSGSLDIDVPIRTQTVTRRLVTGVVRDGTAPIKLRTTSGSIDVVSGEP